MSSPETVAEVVFTIFGMGRFKTLSVMLYICFSDEWDDGFQVYGKGVKMFPPSHRN